MQSNIIFVCHISSSKYLTIVKIDSAKTDQSKEPNYKAHNNLVLKPCLANGQQKLLWGRIRHPGLQTDQRLFHHLPNDLLSCSGLSPVPTFHCFNNNHMVSSSLPWSIRHQESKIGQWSYLFTLSVIYYLTKIDT